jgi:hypothetical protein
VCQALDVSKVFNSTRLLFKKHHFLERFTEFCERKGVSCGILLQELSLFITRICEQKGISCGILLQEHGLLLQDYCAKNTTFLTRFTEVGERKEKSLKHRSNIKNPVHRPIHAQHQIQLIN